jgi:hypothetical protein
MMLTVFSVDHGGEHLLSEIEINDHQLAGVNQVLETYQTHIETVSSASMTNIEISYSSRNAHGTIHGQYTEGSMFQRLTGILDLLLGIAIIEI